MVHFGNADKRLGDDVDQPGKRRRLNLPQGSTSTPTARPTAIQTPRPNPEATFAPPAAPARPSDPVSLYRRGRYMPAGAAYRPMSTPEFLQRSVGYGGTREPGVAASDDLAGVQAYRDAHPPRARAFHYLGPLPVNSSDPASSPSSVTVVRVCPQCREVPLGPGPIVDGKATYPVCEKCRQANIRQQVLRGIAAQALVELSRRTVVHPADDRNREDVRGQDLNGLGPAPNTPQTFLCIRCRRPGVPPAPGRRRCTECICILVAFGPDEEGEDDNGANLWQQQQSQGQHWKVCHVCFSKPAPPGQGRCPDCITQVTPTTPATPLLSSRSVCVICEHNVVVKGQSYCSNC